MNILSTFQNSLFLQSKIYGLSRLAKFGSTAFMTSLFEENFMLLNDTLMFWKNSRTSSNVIILGETIYKLNLWMLPLRM